MIIGFIGFGEVALAFSEILLKNGVKVISSVEGRSNVTKDRAFKSNIKILNSFKEVAESSDILISLNSPSQAISIVEKYISFINGLFLDLNNISPSTTKTIFNIFKDNNKSKNFIDGAIIGKAKLEDFNKKPNIIVSGKKAEELLFFNDYNFNLKVLSKNIGDASTLKMLRSMYTKGVSAILMETFEVADRLNLRQELFEVLTLTECYEFKNSAKSRINNSYKSYYRKSEEMDEVLTFLEDSKTLKEYILTKATKNKFESLKNND